MTLQDLILGRLEDRVEPPENDHRQHHLSVFRRLVVATEKVGDGPEEVALLLKVGQADPLSRRGTSTNRVGSYGHASIVCLGAAAWEGRFLPCRAVSKSGLAANRM